MKKNRSMRLAAILFVVTLLSTCVVSGTFAKYTTSASATAKARVAKFGVTVTAKGDECFATDYDANASSYTVSSQGSDNVVAPGTKNDSAATVTIKGTSEVALDVDFSLGTTKDVFLKAGKYYDMTTSDKTDDTFTLAKDYYPVKFTLKHEFGANCWPIATKSDADNGIKVYAYDSTKTAAAATEVTTAKTDAYQYGGYVEIKDVKLEDIDTVLSAASTEMQKLSPGYTFDDKFTLSWAWDFDASGAGTNDKADTVLAKIADGETVSSSTLKDGTDYCLGEEFNFSITVQQVD